MASITGTLGSVLGRTDTVADVIGRNRGAGPGFDLWRIGLSLMVILTHSFPISYGEGAALLGFPFGPFFAAILPIFFALSGFLVAGSAFRTRSVRVFLSFRILRIVPALMTEVTLAALILGPLMTSLPLSDYFADPRFHVYFGNIVGWVHFYLPGVFETNPRPGIINQNLWTLDPELGCYAGLALLMATRIVYNERLISWLWLAGTVVAIGLNLATGMLELHGAFRAPVLVYYFMTGVVAYHWRDRIPVSGWLAVAAIAISYGLLLLPHTTFIVPPFLVYIMIYVGMLRLPDVKLFKSGDYSYGMYLYGYPVQQTLSHLFPATREWYINFVLATVIALIISMISWHLVEKPALALKRFVKGRPAPIPSTTEPA